MLENQEGKRVAVVVNDLAEVNIDFNLLRRKPVGESDGDLNLDDTVELENGYTPHPRAKSPLAPPATTLPNTATAPRSVRIRVSAMRNRLPLRANNPLLLHQRPRPYQTPSDPIPTEVPQALRRPCTLTAAALSIQAFP